MAYEKVEDNTNNLLDALTISRMNDSHEFWIPSDDLKETLTKKALDFLNERSDYRICLITDRYTLMSHCTEVKVENLPFTSLKRIIGMINNWTTPVMHESYDCTQFDSRLSGLLLSPRSFLYDARKKTYMCWITTNIFNYLKQVDNKLCRKSKKINFKMPKYVIADNFVVGDNPLFKEATYI